MAPTDPQLGNIVEVSAGRGVVRFSGTTAFSPGKWVGIVLDEPKGKNDGTINGIPYFTCRPGYGVFVRPSQVKVIGVEETVPAISQPPVTRPTLGHQRTASTGLARTASLRSAQSSSSRSSSPSKPTAPGSPSTSRTSRLAPAPAPPPASPTKRVRVPSLSLQSRKTLPRQASVNSDLNTPASPSFPTARLASPVQEPTRITPPKLGHQKRASISQRLPTIAAAQPGVSQPVLAAPTPPSSYANGTNGHSPIPAASVARPPSRPPSSLSNQILPTPQVVHDDQENQELRAKIRVLEVHRADDARHIRELETRLSEAESFVALRPKLQAKLSSQQTELIATRRELADAQQLSELAESRILDAQEQLEMAMLDKEVAEERAEIAEAELEDVKERLAIVEVELDVMKEELQDGGGEMGEGRGKTSLEYTQLEKHNERLKEALIRLRDMSQETEHEQRKRIAEMERDLAAVADLQAQYDSAVIKSANAEVQIEDLKLQLDDALGAEEMLVQLTERNLMLGEKIEEMRITIEDLESLQELNDELEENHVETEKALQEDIDAKDIQIREHLRKIESLEDACQDLENTIGQFRELVMQLQSELDALRAQTQTAQHESATAASQTAAMMSMNMKLQSSAAKNQAKAIELEIKKLEARETRELLSIVQPYLPQLYVESDSDATSCYLFFQRLSYKTDLINTVVAQAHGLPESLNGPVSDVLVGVCEMRGRISGLSTLCKRFAAVLRRCDVESFLNIGRLYQEIAPMEKRIDMHIDLLRRDEFREMECAIDVSKIQAQFDHLAETYFSGFDHDLSERELGYALSFDHDLDIFAASIGLTKTSVSAILKDEDVTSDLGGHDPDTELFEPLQKLLDQCKNAKVLSKKLTKRIEDLIEDSAALRTNLLPQLKTLANAISEVINFGISVAQEIMPHLSDARGNKTDFQLNTVIDIVKRTAASTVAKDLKAGMSHWEAVTECMAQLIQDSGRFLPLAMEAENVVKITGTAPWVTRVAHVKASTAINLEAERKVAQLNDEIQGLIRSLKTKDQNVQESAVKIELMERRMEAVKKQADAIVDLEAELSKARKQERAYEEAMEQLQSDLDALEQDNAKLKAVASGPERQASGAQPAETENIAIEGSLETSHLLEQIDALRGTVRFLRTENSYLKGQDLLKELEALPPLPESISRQSTPPLDPSGLSESDESDSEELRPAPTLRSLATETKLLYRDVIKFSSSPKVVDLSALNAKRAEAGHKGGKVWMPKKNMPVHQVLERKAEAERLSRRLRGLLDRADTYGT
ncbi:hypothetical protein PLICRDRAFT_100409 [Plicaturopsis crispa FD-325 SS-3]|nr:hypothetical protein PLICRDRAFT_100409 [Plicaturopsis crispa FD-325 SS-3]